MKKEHFLLFEKYYFNKLSNSQKIDFEKKLSEDNPDDMVLYNLSEELKELFNKFRTHVRKNYE